MKFTGILFVDAAYGCRQFARNGRGRLIPARCHRRDEGRAGARRRKQ